MMSVVYAVVIAPAVQTVQVYPMEQAGQVIVAAFQNIMMEMIVMIVQELQMVIAGTVNAAVLQLITQVMIVMTVMV